jgi:hypothetical protein
MKTQLEIDIEQLNARLEQERNHALDIAARLAELVPPSNRSWEWADATHELEKLMEVLK